jgi:hypothetical protein
MGLEINEIYFALSMLFVLGFLLILRESFSLSILTILLSYMTITRTVSPTGINVPVG